MQTLELREYETRRNARLTHDEARRLRELVEDIQVVKSDDENGGYDITPAAIVGAVRIGDLAVAIQPKIAIDRVLFLISYALDRIFRNDDTFSFREQDSLVEAIVRSFVLRTQEAVRYGLLRDYERFKEDLPTVRGRIRIADQIRERFGIMPPVAVAFDDYTADNLPNRLLKAATWRLLELRLRRDDSRRSLRQLLATFDAVSAVEFDRRRIPEVHYTRQNAHYRGAVELARLILCGFAFDLGHGRADGTAFLIDMNKVFEDFIVVALREALRLDERAFPQGRQICLDVARRVSMKPDLSWWRGERCVFVGDAKYKKLDSALFRHADVYQVLAYLIASDVSRGMLIYAEGEAKEATHTIRHVDREVVVSTIDLRGTPESILASVHRIAERIRSMEREASVV